MAKALPINVYRPAHGYDCTNGGISSRFRELLILCDDGFIEVDLDKPPENLVKMVRRVVFGKTVYYVEPVKRPSGVGWMMGGNYAATSDSRFSEMTNIYGAIAIHDRQESQELYDALSR